MSTDYIEHNRRQDAARAAGKQWVRDLAAKFVAKGWRLVPREGDDCYHELEDASGDRLFINSEWNGKRWSAYMRCPHDGTKRTMWRDLGVIGYNEQAPQAAGTTGRDLDAVYRDILRRAVEPSKPLIAKALEKIAENQERRRGRHAIAKRLCELACDARTSERLADAIASDNNISIGFHDTWRAEVGYNGHVKFETADLDLATVERLVRVLEGKAND